MDSKLSVLLGKPLFVKNGIDHLHSRATLAFQSRLARLKKLRRDFQLDRELGKIAKVERALLAEARRRYEAGYGNMSRPLVSVMIPTYNRGKLLVERTLPSVFSQTYQNFEIVIVGDCCTDDTAERIKKIRDPRVRFYDLPRRAIYPKDLRHMSMVNGVDAGNLAIQLSAGDWFAYMDDDDVFLPDHIEVLLSFALSGNYEVVCARHNVEVAPDVWQTDQGTIEFPNGRRPYRGNTVPHRTVMYRSYLRFFRVRWDAWKYGIGGDYLMWLHMGRAGVRAGFLDKVVALKHLRAPYTNPEWLTDS